MNEQKFNALAADLAKGIKTEADLSQLTRMVTKLKVETALNTELSRPRDRECAFEPQRI